MKKFLVLVLIVALVLCGCGKVANSYSRGTVANNSYESEFLGLGVRLGENWVFYDDAQIAALYGYTTDLMGDDFDKYLENATIIYDMHATNTLDFSSLGINFEKLSALGEVQTANMETFVSSIMPTTIQALENVGCTNTSYDLCQFDVGGKTAYGAKISAELSGVQIYEAVICIKCDGYVANISIATYYEDTTQSIIDCFYSLK